MTTLIEASDPFARIARSEPGHARSLAIAFTSSHDFQGVLACLRFESKCADHASPQLYHYLEGCHFADAGYTYAALDGSAEEFDECRQLAWDHLDAARWSDCEAVAAGKVG